MRVYLDHNAATPPLGAARAAAAAACSQGWAHPASPHAEGRRSRQLVEDARQAVGMRVGVPPEWVIFTSGGTEAAHAALRGSAAAAGRLGSIVISGLEHPCMRAAAAALEEQGHTLRVVAPGRDGVVEAGRFIEACGPDTRAAALMWAHNEIGTLQPVTEVAAELALRGIPLVADGVQVYGGQVLRPAVQTSLLGLISAQKMGGLPGAGALLVHPEAPLVPHQGGGKEERGRRGGTPPVALIAAFGAAAGGAAPTSSSQARMADLRDHLDEWLLEHHPEVEILGWGRPRLAGTTAFRLAGVRGEDVVAALDLKGIAVSTGAACSSGSAQPSASLQAMGYAPDQAREMVRISLGRETTTDEVERALEALGETLPRLLRFGCRGRGVA